MWSSSTCIQISCDEIVTEGQCDVKRVAGGRGCWLLSTVRRAWIKAEWRRDGGAKGEGVITSPPLDFYWPINIDLCLMPSHIWIAGMRTGCTSWLDDGFMRSARSASARRGSCKPSRKLSLVPFIYTEFITLTSMRRSLIDYYLF